MRSKGFGKFVFNCRVCLRLLPSSLQAQFGKTINILKSEALIHDGILQYIGLING